MLAAVEGLFGTPPASAPYLDAQLARGAVAKVLFVINPDEKRYEGSDTQLAIQAATGKYLRSYRAQLCRSGYWLDNQYDFSAQLALS